MVRGILLPSQVMGHNHHHHHYTSAGISPRVAAMGYSIRTSAWPRELVQVKPGVAAAFLLWPSCSRFQFWLLQSVELLLVLTLLLSNCSFVFCFCFFCF